MPTLQPLEGTPGYYLWFYVPNLWASLVFLIIFTILTALHIWRMVRTKTWFCIAFVIGGIFELLGYAMRAMAYHNTGMIMPYAFYAMATLLAPALFAATIYMALGRLLRATQSQSLLIVPEKWVTGLFVGGDIASFVVQGGGCGLMVMRDLSLVAIGEDVVVAGLVIQIAMFGFFVVTTIVAHRRIHQSPTRIDQSIDIEQGLWMLYSVSALIMVRSIFRLIEFIQGREGYLLQTEWPTLVFDGALMIFTMAIFFWWHPYRFMSPKPNETLQLGSVSDERYLTKDGGTQSVGDVS